MGYTHYWNKQESTNEQWNNFKSLAGAVLALPQVRCCVAYEMDRPDDPPQLDDEFLRLNGKGLYGYETLLITRGKESEFCKTARNPYDDVVVALLALLKATHGDAVTIRSDATEHQEIAEGIRLAAQVMVGTGIPEQLKIPLTLKELKHVPSNGESLSAP